VTETRKKKKENRLLGEEVVKDGDINLSRLGVTNPLSPRMLMFSMFNCAWKLELLGTP
jgi:hypothetical protein